MGREAIGPVCCITHVNKTSASKREGVGPGVPGFDWQHVAPQHVVNHAMVLSNKEVS